MCLFKIKNDIIFLLNRLNTRYIVFKYCPKKKKVYIMFKHFPKLFEYTGIFFPILWSVQKPSDSRKPNRDQHILVWLNILYRPIRRCGVYSPFNY